MVPIQFACDDNVVEASIIVLRRGLGPNEAIRTSHREGILNQADAESFTASVEEVAIKVAGKLEHNGNAVIILTTKVNGSLAGECSAVGVFTLEEALRVEEDCIALLGSRLKDFKAKKNIA